MVVDSRLMTTAEIAATISEMHEFGRPIAFMSYDTADAIRHAVVDNTDEWIGDDEIDSSFLVDWVRAVFKGHECACDLCGGERYPELLLVARPLITLTQWKRIKRPIPGVVIEVCSLCVAPHATIAERAMQHLMQFTTLVPRRHDGSLIKRPSVH